MIATAHDILAFRAEVDRARKLLPAKAWSDHQAAMRAPLEANIEKARRAGDAGLQAAWERLRQVLD